MVVATGGRGTGSAAGAGAALPRKGARLGGTAGPRQGSARPGKASGGCGRAALRPAPLLRQPRHPRPAPGTSPASKVLSGFLGVKHRDNYKPLKTDGVSSPSFTGCKPPRLATRCKHCPLRSSTPPSKGQTRGKAEQLCQGEQRRDSRSRLPAGRERARPPASSTWSRPIPYF